MLDDIISHYGERHQIIQSIQELNELSTALTRNLLTFHNRENIIEEIADVLVMIDQLKSIFGITTMELNDIKFQKVARQRSRISEDNINEYRPVYASGKSL